MTGKTSPDNLSLYWALRVMGQEVLPHGPAGVEIYPGKRLAPGIKQLITESVCGLRRAAEAASAAEDAIERARRGVLVQQQPRATT